MSKILTLFVSVFFVMLAGCGSPGRAEFVTLVQNHKELTTETNLALIESVMDEMRQLQESGVSDPGAVEAYEDLINRLKTILKQSELIDGYVNATQVDSDLIAEMVRQRWSDNK